MIPIPYGKAICYSGYRDGQSPVHSIYPSYDEIREDLQLLEQDFDYIRVYDAGEHAKTVLDVIHTEQLNLKVMLGIALQGEISNPHCAWGGRLSDEEIKSNIDFNDAEVDRAIQLCKTYQDHILAISAGNENTPVWNDRLVDANRILSIVNTLKEHCCAPVTYCDNHANWHHDLVEVAEAVDVISVHSYPVWVGTPLEEAIGLTMREYDAVRKRYPHKQVVITETGWPTRANGGQIQPHNASEIHQRFFNREVDKWSQRNNIVTFFFEAFDESWKGSDHPDEPEKHWGYYTLRRTPKLIVQEQ